tara:strand:+ start:744 stop:1511 length:768 start_codon:yes stop_codon:yes gene_type:complete
MIETKIDKPEFVLVANIARKTVGRITNRHNGKHLTKEAISAALVCAAKRYGMLELIMDDDGLYYADLKSALAYLSTYAVLDGKPLEPVPNDEMVVTSELLEEFMKNVPINPSTGKPASRSKVRSSIQNGAAYGFFDYKPISNKKSYVGRRGALAHLDRVYPNVGDSSSVGGITTEESKYVSASNETDWESALIRELRDTITVALQTLKAAEREENLTWKFQGYNEAKQFLQSGMDAFEASPASDAIASEQSEFLF